jgi:anti-sigma factor RsiW
MTQCWSEGELRAYLDGELSARDMERLAGHLKQCRVCGALYAELAARAEQLRSWMEALPDADAPVRIPAVPRRAGAGRRWAGVAVGLAASLAIALVMLPKRTENPGIPPRPQAAAPHTAPPAVVKPAIIRRESRQPGVSPKPKPQIQSYVALDNEPIETGLVVRVGLNGGQVPADVIVGPDGRARAIRLISESSGETQ